MRVIDCSHDIALRQRDTLKSILLSSLIDASTVRTFEMNNKRDSDYYRSRLKKEFPAIYDDLRAGRIKSVRQAAATAGLIHLPGRVTALKREWKRASPRQRKQFLEWVRSSGVGLKPTASAIVDSSGRLKPRVVTVLMDWTKQNRVTPGRIMKDMGFSNFDYRLAQALKGTTGLPRDVADKLAQWMAKQGL